MLGWFGGLLWFNMHNRGTQVLSNVPVCLITSYLGLNNWTINLLYAQMRKFSFFTKEIMPQLIQWYIPGMWSYVTVKYQSPYMFSKLVYWCSIILQYLSYDIKITVDKIKFKHTMHFGEWNKCWEGSNITLSKHYHH